MILSAGLTPAWQQVLVFESFRYGEVNRAQDAAWCASGKVLNAGIAAHHLGGGSRTLSPLGGPAEAPIRAELDGLGVACRWVKTESPTRVCTTMLDRASGLITELVENGRPLLDSELERFCKAFAEEAAKASVVVLIGSLPLRAPESMYRQLLSETRLPSILDFRGPGLLSVLDLHPLLVKPNREELEITAGRPLTTDQELLEAMRQLNELGARWVLVTHGPEAAWLSSRSDIYRFQPPTLSTVVNPIGSGDALAATVAWAVRDGLSVPEAVRLGIAAAAQNVAQLLPCRLEPDRLAKEAEDVVVDSVV